MISLAKAFITFAIIHRNLQFRTNILSFLAFVTCVRLGYCKCLKDLNNKKEIVL